MVNFNRSDYLDGKCTHHEYYSQFVSDELLDAVIGRIGSDQIVSSKDKHLNDIELRRWDSLQDLVRSYCRLSLSEANHGAGISLSDCVCVAKAAARMHIEKSKARRSLGEALNEDQ